MMRIVNLNLSLRRVEKNKRARLCIHPLMLRSLVIRSAQLQKGVELVSFSQRKCLWGGFNHFYYHIIIVRATCINAT